MKIVKKYESWKENFNSKKFAITIEIQDNNKMARNVFKMSNICSEDYSEWVIAKNLMDEEFLIKNNVEYIKNDKGEIIPIGLVKFVDNKGYYDYSLNIIVQEESEMCKIEQLIQNITEAIKYRYKAYEFINKYKESYLEEVEEF